MILNNFRNIWSSYEKSRIEILESGAIKSITLLLVRTTEKSYDSRHAELSETCLKAMCAFIGSLDPRCGMQMSGDSDLEGYKCIIKYCEAKNKLALKCLYSLSQIAECRPSLGSSGAIERLITLVTRNTVLSWEILATLCLFCREAINRARIKLGSGLEVSILQKFNVLCFLLYEMFKKEFMVFLDSLFSNIISVIPQYNFEMKKNFLGVFMNKLDFLVSLPQNDPGESQKLY